MATTHKHYNVGPHATREEAEKAGKPEGSYWQLFAITGLDGVVQYVWGRDYAGAALYYCRGVGIKISTVGKDKMSKAEKILEGLTPEQREKLMAAYS